MEMLYVLQIFPQERKLIYTEKNVQDVITKYSAMCCGKYKQFEGKSDFIRATPFQYLQVCLLGGITPPVSYLNLQQDKLSLREFATSHRNLTKVYPTSSLLP
jgi:hypothetical protein